MVSPRTGGGAAPWASSSPANGQQRGHRATKRRHKELSSSAAVKCWCWIGEFPSQIV